MSNNMISFGQAQAFAPLCSPDMPRPIPLPYAVQSNNGGTGDGPTNAPIMFETIHASTQAPVSAQPPLNAAILADWIARKGVPSGVAVAVRHHRAINPTDPPTVDELLSRLVDAQVKLGVKYFDYRQFSPNAIALRLMAPRAGPSYTFEENETTFTNRMGKTITGRKCGGPGCEFRNSDHKRHLEEMHIRDPVTALFCPYQNCKRAHFAGRESEMRDDIQTHEKRNDPLSFFSVPST